jgi:hypothetical protein
MIHTDDELRIAMIRAADLRVMLLDGGSPVQQADWRDELRDVEAEIDEYQAHAAMEGYDAGAEEAGHTAAAAAKGRK